MTRRLLQPTISKYSKIGAYGFCAVLLICAALGLRIALLAAGWPGTNSDEATMDLMALHIAYRGDAPIFFYGQRYMGAIEAYIGAGLFHIFGASVLAVRIGLLVFFALFLLCMYGLISLLYNRRFALVSLILLSLGSDIAIKHQLEAIGGYPELVCFGALMFLLAVRLALTYEHRYVLRDRQREGHTFSRASMASRRGLARQRLLLYWGWGLVVGLALWSDFLVLPLVAAAGAILLIWCWHELWRGGMLAILLGAVIGAFPLILYNVNAPFALNSIAIFLGLSRVGADQIAAQHISFLQNIVGTVLIALPVATSVHPQCPVEVFPFFNSHASAVIHYLHPRRCLFFQSAWGIAYIILWLVAAALTIRALCQRQEDAEKQREWRVRHTTRLLLLLSAAITILFYMRSPSAALSPVSTSRYLICILVALPAVLWPLWSGVEATVRAMLAASRVEQQDIQDTRALTPKPLMRLLSGATVLVALCSTLFFIGMVLLVGTKDVFTSAVPQAQASNRHWDALAHDLLLVHATRIYTDYWSCNVLAFHTNERIICSDLDAWLHRDVDRYRPYRTLVQQAPLPAYVFPLGSPQADAFDRFIVTAKVSYRKYVFDGYVVYMLEGRVAIPEK